MYISLKILRYFIESGILLYSFAIFGSYLILACISVLALIKYLRKNSFVDYNVLLNSNITPTVSIIAPAFNEGKTIVENVRSLLSVHYNKFEVIIVNDGSTDDSLAKLIKEYELELTDYLMFSDLETKQINGVYKSKNKAFANLKVVDKQNGGKADSLNAGINISEYKLFAAIDVDCVLEYDAILKMVKPFMEETTRKVIATGGVIGVANNCRIENGKVIDINVPKKFIERIQILEYTRAFLMGRMAWAKLNGLLLISGAFGLFDREIAVKAGGYNHNTVGEDMELVVRMRRYMHEIKINYHVAFIPNYLCWTEVPSNLKTLGKQRNRWARGTIDSLFFHTKLFFNRKYGVLGMLGYPYWLFFEWLAPLIETFGILYFLIIAVLGEPNWGFFLLLLGFVYLFAVTFSIWAILLEELAFHRYEKKRDIIKLFVTALFEPLFYHPLTVWFALRGNYFRLIGIQSWGKMVRTGFDKNKSQ